jgi:hypothetical protein
VTVASCIATFELVRRVPLLRPWFGLKSRAAGRRPTSIKTGAVLER